MFNENSSAIRFARIGTINLAIDHHGLVQLGKFEPEARPLPRFALHANLTAHQGRELLDQREAQPGPLVLSRC